MKITPAEIENKRFRRRFRGFDRQEVLHFLGEVSEEMLALAGRMEELEREHGELDRRIEEYRKRDGAIQETLLAVRKLADEIRDEARRDADLIVREARLTGETQLRQARECALRIEDEIVHLRLERDNFEDRVRMAAEEHLRVLDARREEGEVREKLRLLSLRHGQSAPPLPFTETIGALPSPAPAPDTERSAAGAVRLPEPGHNGGTN
jgi:cell division initiation protein